MSTKQRNTDKQENTGRIASRVPWRAVLGAALITCAAAGVLVAHRSAQQPPSSRYLVATRDIAAGEVVNRDDLGSVAVDLPAALSATPASDASEVVGRVAATNIGASSLVGAEQLLEDGRLLDPSHVEVTITVDPLRAPLDAIAAGETIHLLTTDPNGKGSRVLSENVRLVSVSDEDDSSGIGSAVGVSVRLGLPDVETATSVVDAAVREEITLVVPSPLSGDPPSPGDGSQRSE